MTRQLLSLTGAVLLTTTLHAQAPTPATQPARPPDRPPTGEPSPPALPLPAPDRGGDDERPFPPRPTPESGDPEMATLTLKGCLERVDGKAFRLRDVKGDDATVTKDVRVQGALDELRDHVGSVVELRGTFQQDTPASTEAFFNVTRVRKLADTCSSGQSRP